MKNILARFRPNPYVVTLVMVSSLPAFFVGEGLRLVVLHFRSGLNFSLFSWLVQLGGFLYTLTLALLVHFLFHVERFRRLHPVKLLFRDLVTQPRRDS